MTQRRLWTVGFCLVGLLVVGFGVQSLAAADTAVDGTENPLAGDEPTLVFPEQEEHSAPPGGTVQMNVVVKSDGGVDDAGVKSITLVTDYDQEYLELRNVEPHRWLEGDGETEVQTETAVDEERGNVTIDQWRDPPSGGETGTKVFATLTFDIREDAPETNATVSFKETSVQIIEDYPMYVYNTNATITIDEDAADPGENLELEATDGTDTATGDGEGDDDANTTDAGTDASDADQGTDGNSNSLFDGRLLLVALAGTAGVVVAGTLVWRRRQ